MICEVKQPKRVTVEDAKRAFEETGLKPTTAGPGDYGVSTGCILVALSAQSGVVRGHSETGVPYMAWARDTYGNEYTRGLFSAWDGAPLDGLGETEKLGYADGLACRRAILETQSEPVCAQRAKGELVT